MPAALTYTYCTVADLQALMSNAGETSTVDDTQTGSGDATFESKAISWATAKVNFYCLGRYDASSLAQSWIVNNWCVLCAAKWLGSRRGNPPPQSLDDLYDEALKDMEMVRSGKAQLPDLGERDVAWPAWSNVRVDVLYNLRRVRTERPISENTPTPYPQKPDWGAEYSVEF